MTARDGHNSCTAIYITHRRTSCLLQKQQPPTDGNHRADQCVDKVDDFIGHPFHGILALQRRAEDALNIRRDERRDAGDPETARSLNETNSVAVQRHQRSTDQRRQRAFQGDRAFRAWRHALECSDEERCLAVGLADLRSKRVGQFGGQGGDEAQCEERW